MSDISQCQHSDCPKANQCYRFLAHANPQYQAYNRFKNICFLENGFKYFWQADQSLVKVKDNKELSKGGE